MLGARLGVGIELLGYMFGETAAAWRSASSISTFVSPFDSRNWIR